MIVTIDDRHSLRLSAMTAELLCLVGLAYIYLLPLDRWVQIAITWAAVLLLITAERIVTAMELERKIAGQSTWFNDLTLRKALDQSSGTIWNEQLSLRFDWQEASRAAAEDIKSAMDDDKFRHKLGFGPFISAPLYFLVGIGVVFLRPALALGIAWIVKAIDPGIVLRLM